MKLAIGIWIAVASGFASKSLATSGHLIPAILFLCFLWPASLFVKAWVKERSR